MVTQCSKCQQVLCQLEIQGWNAQVELNRLQSKHNCKEIGTKSPRDHRPTGGSVLSRLAYSETASRSISRKGTNQQECSKTRWASVLCPSTARTACHCQAPPGDAVPPPHLWTVSSTYTNVSKKCASSRETHLLLSSSALMLIFKTHLAFPSVMLALEQQPEILIKVGIIKIVQVTMGR